jgi:Na+-driven multidrug efflux pump
LGSLCSSTFVCPIYRVELWSIETSTLFAAHLNSRSLSAQAVVQQVIFTAYLVMTAVGDAGNILIGRSIGANKPMDAIHSKNVIYIVTAMFAAFNMSVIVIAHRWLPLMFSVQTVAMPLARNVLLLAAFFSLFDAYHIVQTGIAKSW